MYDGKCMRLCRSLSAHFSSEPGQVLFYPDQPIGLWDENSEDFDNSPIRAYAELDFKFDIPDDDSLYTLSKASLKYALGKTWHPASHPSHDAVVSLSDEQIEWV